MYTCRLGINAVTNLLILYNPYYQNDVIEQHVNVLLEQDSQMAATVAFGKVQSKLRDYSHPSEEQLQKLYDEVSEKNYLQLFLTDYASVYVAKVIKVVDGSSEVNAPQYYKEKQLAVEKWFIISDIRMVVHNDFELVRNKVLSNFTTPHFENHHYAVYGNSYVYPLIVEMDNSIDYFEVDNASFRYFTEIFKSEKRLKIKQRLIDYCFGEEMFYALHPNTQDALISAEIEYQENKGDTLYDFTSVVVNLSKAFEKEVYLFLKKIFAKLMHHNKNLQFIEYSVQGGQFTLKEYLNNKPNLGTHNYLLRNREIKNTIWDSITNNELKFFLTTTIPKAITDIQPIRNESVHAEAASLKDCVAFRRMIFGVGRSGILSEFIKFGKGV